MKPGWGGSKVTVTVSDLLVRKGGKLMVLEEVMGGFGEPEVTR